MLLLSTSMCSIGNFKNCFIASGVCSGPFSPSALILLLEYIFILLYAGLLQ